MTLALPALPARTLTLKCGVGFHCIILDVYDFAFAYIAFSFWHSLGSIDWGFYRLLVNQAHVLLFIFGPP